MAPAIPSIVSARTFGGEAGVAWRLDDNWKTDLSLAYVRGTNETDDRPLAQLPPLESRLSVTYGRSVGRLLRGVEAQNRVAINQGNIVGQDIGTSPGFVITSLNGSWRMGDHARLSAGVDNLFDKTYAEHISRSASMIPGYIQTTRVNEPGHLLWARLDVNF